MQKFKIGDILIRNNVSLEHHYMWETDPRKIKIIGYSSIDKIENFSLNLCNGYIIQDIFTSKKECATPEYVEHYYELDQRKEKLEKLDNYE